MNYRQLISIFAVLVSFSNQPSSAQQELTRLTNCRYIATEWSDGDSFRVADGANREFTVRLYGVDCLESRISDESDARRLRAQRRYFGISSLGGSPQASINAAKRMGCEAKDFIVNELKKPFTVVTANSDARGDSKYKRVYGFVITSNGKDLAELLVQQGHARAFGVSRSTIDGRSRDEYRKGLEDVELLAIKRGVGVWSSTDWDALPSQRRKARAEEAELAMALGKAPLTTTISLNSATRGELMRLPGIGETYANRIIEHRPFKSIEELLDVSGLGQKKINKIRPYLKIKAKQ